MEKRKLLPLSFKMLCSLCFATACKTTTTSTNVIATVAGKNITVENLYANGLYSESTAEYIYKILEKALIQSAAPATNSMKRKVENEVNKWVASIKENAKLNGTDYDDDLATALEEEGASSVEELIENKLYALQQEYVKELFFEEKGDEYRNQYIDSNYLYHASDIVLSTSGTSTTADLYGLTLSSTEAKKIYDTITELVDGENYYNVAEKYSSGSTASKGGDLGIVTLNDNSITNELRYALIGYSSIVEDKYSSFNLPTNEYSQNLIELYNAGMEAIPYSYIKGLNEVYSTSGNTETKNYDTNTNFYYSGGNNYLTSTGRSYYRNIIYNVLLNTRTPRFITLTEEELKDGVNAVKMNVRMPNITTQGYATETTEQYVLTNELGNPYVVFKDSSGIHIMSITKTPFASDIYDYYDDEPSAEDQVVAYAEYGSDIDNRLETVQSMAKNYITRKYAGNEGEEKLLSFEIFKYLLEKGNNGGFEISDEKIEKMIFQYMDSITSNIDASIKNAYNGYYDTYSNLIWFRHQDYIVQEVPLLSCLTKVSDGNYGCTYKFGKGFLNHAPTTESGGNN